MVVRAGDRPWRANGAVSSVVPAGADRGGSASAVADREGPTAWLPVRQGPLLMRHGWYAGRRT